MREILDKKGGSKENKFLIPILTLMRDLEGNHSEPSNELHKTKNKEEEKPQKQNVKKVLLDLKKHETEKYQKIMIIEQLLLGKEKMSLQVIREYARDLGNTEYEKVKRDVLTRKILLNLMTFQIDQIDLLIIQENSDQKNQLEVLSDAILQSRK
ncbi:hypothetical protein [Tepidibacillus marianensis]|uniref:hypothetical protein n=1 Tax=Tepidibacillus marianensis TaxID=3131995 RepID=UPI0030CE7E27